MSSKNLSFPAGGKDSEAWYMSRRIWGAILSVIAVILLGFFPGQFDLIIAICASIASGLGITSWNKPKRQ